jgi:hypothetical protein
MKIRPVGGGCFMPRERQTDTTKLTVAFRNFANATKSVIQLQLQIRGNSLDLAKFGNKKKSIGREKKETPL